MTNRPPITFSVSALIILLTVAGALSCHSDGHRHMETHAVAPTAVDDLDRSIGQQGGEFSGTAMKVRLFFRPLPAAMPGAEDDTADMVALGRRLFFERGVSQNKTQACNDCHRLDHRLPGVDNQPVSKGAKGISGERNSPTVLNAGFHVAQFWDGRAADLVEQAKRPVLNPKEMAMDRETDVVIRLRHDPEYGAAFGKAFAGQAEPITFDNVARAIAAFERTLVAPGRFDRYIQGETAALTTGEKLGFIRFVETGCIECHTGATIGGRVFEKFGVFHPYVNQKDLGRYEVTKRDEDRLFFKVPSLRNVTLTPPHFHDGGVTVTSEAVRLMAWMQLDTVLSPAERAEIVRFLRTLEFEKHPLEEPPHGEAGI